MKRSICLWVLLFVVAMVSAQTQYGYVKTKGRMVSGNYICGKGLPGASVTIKNLTPIVIRSQDGAFSFPVPKGLKYCVNSVEMKDYQLLDMSLLRPRTYSGDTILLVMVNPAQQKADEVTKEREFRRKAEERLQRLEDSILSLNISLEEKGRQLEEIEKDRAFNEKYIKELAKYYATIDYDRISDFQREVDSLLEQGEFNKARQLLYSKGNVADRLEDIRLEEEAEAQRDAEIQMALETNNLAKSGTMSKKEELEQNCYSLFSSFLLEQQFDSASYYIEFRANIDTTNAKWQYDAASYFIELFAFDKAEMYYLKALNNYYKTYEENCYKIGIIKNAMSSMYQIRGQLDKSAMLLKEAYDIYSEMDSSYFENGIDFDKKMGLLMTSVNLASVYYGTDTMHCQADSLVEKALEIIGTIHNEEYQEFMPAILSLLGAMQSYAYQTNDHEKLMNVAIETARQMALNDTSNYDLLATTLFWSAIPSFERDDFERTESLLLEALDYMRLSELYNSVDEESNIAEVKQLLGWSYFNKKDYHESEKWYVESLDFYRRNAVIKPDRYNGPLFGILARLAMIYKEKQSFYESETLFKEALSLDINKTINDLVECDYETAFVQNEIGQLKVLQNQKLEAIPYFNDALEKRRRFTKDNPKNDYSFDLANTLFFLGNIYSDDSIGRYEEGVAALSEAATIIRPLLAECQPEQEQQYESSLAMVLLQLGVDYYNLHQYDASLAALSEAVDLYQNLSDREPLYKMLLAMALGAESIPLVYFGRFAEAEQQAETALYMNPGLQWVFSSLAASILFQGRFNEAEEIYRDMNDRGVLKDRFIRDLEDLEAAGIIPEERKSDVERIKKMLLE